MMIKKRIKRNRSFDRFQKLFEEEVPKRPKKYLDLISQEERNWFVEAFNQLDQMQEEFRKEVYQWTKKCLANDTTAARRLKEMYQLGGHANEYPKTYELICFETWRQKERKKLVQEKLFKELEQLE